MLNPYDELKRELEQVKRELQKLKDDQIKQNRDYKDAMYNLDADNIPSLQGIVKKVNLIVSEDGTVKAEFVMEVINNESNAKIKADRINLEGLVLNLTANNITISSDNLSVDKNGHVVMGSADIKQSCVLASDIDEGSAMRIGPPYVDSLTGSADPNDANISYSELDVFYEDDGYSVGSSRGLSLTTVFQRSSASSDGSTLVSEIRESAKEIKLHSYGSTDFYDDCEVGIKRDGEQGNTGVAYLKVGENYLWVDNEGVHMTANEIDFDAFFPV